MTISSENRKAGPFTGNGSTTSFPFTFKVFTKSDLQVVRRDANGVEHVLVLDSDYSVTLNADQDNDPGGAVTFPLSGSALPSTQTLTIAGALDYLQPADITNQGGFYPQVVENALDRAVILIQQLKTLLNGALQLPISTPAGVSTQLPVPEANKIIAWNQAANALQNLDTTELATLVAYGTAKGDIFTGDGSTTQFTLTSNPGALNNLDVAVGGITQLPNVDYSWNGGALVTFTSPPPNGEKVFVRYMQGLPFGTVQGADVVGGVTWENTITGYDASNLVDGSVVHFKGRDTVGDGGGGPLRFLAGSTATANGVTIYAVTGGRLVREGWSVFGVDVRWAGAKGDGITDDTAAFKAALAASYSVFIPSGNYLVTDTLSPRDTSTIRGQDKNHTIISFNPDSDKDLFVVGWYTTIERLTLKSNAPAGGSKGVIRLQSLTNADIPTNVGGNNWTDPEIGGLSYKNTLRDLVVENGQNYNIYGVNIAYTVMQNVRSVLARGTAGNLRVWGKGGSNMPSSTTLTVINGEFTACQAGPGISFETVTDSTLIGVIAEGNNGRGMLFQGCSNVQLLNPYIENNFALGAPIGDGDLVVVNSKRVAVNGGLILGNNSSNAISASGNVDCSIAGTTCVKLDGVPHTVLLDAGFVQSSNGLAIVKHGVHAGGRWVQYADGTASYSKKVTWTGNIATASGSLFLSNDAIADTDFPSIFMSDGASGYVFQSAFHVLSDGAAFVWVISGGASRVNNAIRYRLASTLAQTGITIDIQIVMTGRWK